MKKFIAIVICLFIILSFSTTAFAAGDISGEIYEILTDGNIKEYY